MSLAANIGIAVAIGVVVVGLAGYVIGLYNTLVQVRSNVRNAFGNIDVLLQQRHDELPNLVEVCKGYMRHEAAVLENVARLRSGYDRAPDVRSKVAAENSLNAALGGLMATVERYPDLKAVETFMKVQERISDLEAAIADRRELFNDSVNIHNITIERFPEVIFARLFGYRPLAFLQVPAESRTAVKVKLP